MYRKNDYMENSKHYLGNSGVKMANYIPVELICWKDTLEVEGYAGSGGIGLKEAFSKRRVLKLKCKPTRQKRDRGPRVRRRHKAKSTAWEENCQ